jgi:hypothetical protein
MAWSKKVRAFDFEFSLDDRASFKVAQIKVLADFNPTIEGNTLSPSCKIHRLHLVQISAKMVGGNSIDVTKFTPTYDWTKLPELAQWKRVSDKVQVERDVTCNISYINTRGPRYCYKVSAVLSQYRAEARKIEGSYKQQKAQSMENSNYLIELENNVFISCENIQTTKELASALGNSLTVYLEI